MPKADRTLLAAGCDGAILATRSDGTTAVGEKGASHVNTTSPDPYPAQKGLKAPTCCSHCHATYHAKDWVSEPRAFAAAMENPETRRTLCPACHNMSEDSPQEVATLRGGCLWEHEVKICNIIGNIEVQVTERNPLERILRIDRQNETMVIATSAEQLRTTRSGGPQGPPRGTIAKIECRPRSLPGQEGAPTLSA